MNGPFYYVSVAGILGSGKSTACNLLAQKLGFHVFQEKVDGNSFLPFFYEDPRRWAFHAQMFYLHAKADQLKEIKNLLATTHVLQDAPIQQDRLMFAKAQQVLGHMSSDEFALYEKYFDALQQGLPIPHLIVNLETSPNVIMERMRRRGREYEKSIKLDYVKLLSELQEKWTSENKQFNILNVNTDKLDLRDNPKDQMEFTSKVSDRIGISRPS